VSVAFAGKVLSANKPGTLCCCAWLCQPKTKPLPIMLYSILTSVLWVVTVFVSVAKDALANEYYFRKLLVKAISYTELIVLSKPCKSSSESAVRLTCIRTDFILLLQEFCFASGAGNRPERTVLVLATTHAGKGRRLALFGQEWLDARSGAYELHEFIWVLQFCCRGWCFVVGHAVWL